MTGYAKTAFRSPGEAALAPRSLEARTKDLVGLACAITRRCEGCIQHHVKAAAEIGAIQREIRETLDVCVLMVGGPAVTHPGKAFEFLGSLRTS